MRRLTKEQKAANYLLGLGAQAARRGRVEQARVYLTKAAELAPWEQEVHTALRLLDVPSEEIQRRQEALGQGTPEEREKALMKLLWLTAPLSYWKRREQEFIESGEARQTVLWNRIRSRDMEQRGWAPKVRNMAGVTLQAYNVRERYERVKAKLQEGVSGG